jgi:hypothetical protein
MWACSLDGNLHEFDEAQSWRISPSEPNEIQQPFPGFVESGFLALGSIVFRG